MVHSAHPYWDDEGIGSGQCYEDSDEKSEDPDEKPEDSSNSNISYIGPIIFWILLIILIVCIISYF